jgi:hypothetical protein
MEDKAQPDTKKVYHGTDKKSVRAIYNEIEISRLEEGDFNQSQTGRAFYTTEQESYAEEWATKRHGDDAVIIQFKVELKGLKVLEFPEKDIGRWQTVRNPNS